MKKALISALVAACSVCSMASVAALDPAYQRIEFSIVSPSFDVQLDQYGLSGEWSNALPSDLSKGGVFQSVLTSANKNGLYYGGDTIDVMEPKKMLICEIGLQLYQPNPVAGTPFKKKVSVTNYGLRCTPTIYPTPNGMQVKIMVSDQGFPPLKHA